MSNKVDKLAGLMTLGAHLAHDYIIEGEEYDQETKALIEKAKKTMVRDIGLSKEEAEEVFNVFTSITRESYGFEIELNECL